MYIYIYIYIYVSLYRYIYNYIYMYIYIYIYIYTYIYLWIYISIYLYVYVYVYVYWGNAAVSLLTGNPASMHLVGDWSRRDAGYRVNCRWLWALLGIFLDKFRQPQESPWITSRKMLDTRALRAVHWTFQVHGMLTCYFQGPSRRRKRTLRQKHLKNTAADHGGVNLLAPGDPSADGASGLTSKMVFILVKIIF